jgi:hypothetical protein
VFNFFKRKELFNLVSGEDACQIEPQTTGNFIHFFILFFFKISAYFYNSFLFLITLHLEECIVISENENEENMLI